MPSPTVENYLKQILMISLESHKREVPMGLISDSLKVTPGTATSMVKNLEKEGWLSYKSRKGVKLTASGRKLGMNILRRHRLLETFWSKRWVWTGAKFMTRRRSWSTRYRKKFSNDWTTFWAGQGMTRTVTPFRPRGELFKSTRTVPCSIARKA